MKQTRSPERPLSTRQVCVLVGVSYRQLDYWLRTGAITSPDNTDVGSGRWRAWSQADVRRLKACVARLREARETLASFSSGEMWAEADGDAPDAA